MRIFRRKPGLSQLHLNIDFGSHSRFIDRVVVSCSKRMMNINKMEKSINRLLDVEHIEAQTRSLEKLIIFMHSAERGKELSENIFVASIRAIEKVDSNQAFALGEELSDSLFIIAVRRRMIGICIRKNQLEKAEELIDSLPDNQWNEGTRKRIETNRKMSLTNQDLDSIEPIRPELSVACILDEFSWENLRHECKLYRLSLNDWRYELESNPPDFLLVESAWAGNGGKWQYKITYKTPRSDNPLFELIEYCKSNTIPTVFWNKEDPPNYSRFIDAARRFDYIFTTDEDCLTKYQKDAPESMLAVLPFAAQPLIQNPVNRSRLEKLGEICFAGAWYPRHPERFEDLRILLNASAGYQTHIYDRYLNHPQHEKYKFPENYSKLIKGSLKFSEMNKVYKQYDIFLNVNSVKDSPTMFSRRVLEIIASGTAVVSGYARGIEEVLGTGTIPMCSTQKEANTLVNSLMNDSEKRDKIVLTAQRKIFESHTYGHRINSICEKIGLELADKADRVSVVTATIREEFVDNLFQNFERQSYPYKDLIIVINENKPLTKEYIEERGIALGAENYQILVMPEVTTLGACLNAGVAAATGNLFAKMDDDDYYGENFLLDSVHALNYSRADCVGKETYFTYSEGLDQVFLRSPERENRYTRFVIGTTLVGKVSLFPEISFGDRRVGEDTVFLNRMAEAEKIVYSHSQYNYLKFYAKSLDRHTWKIEADDYLGKAKYIGEGYAKERYCF